MCEPRWATRRSPGRESYGSAIAAIADRIGQPLMPWQRMVADVGGEIDPLTGLPAYRKVAVTVPRQNGKTTLLLSWELQRAIGFAQEFGPQRIVYSAQTGSDARKKLVEDQMPVLERHRKPLGIVSMTRANGNESVVFRNGSRLVLMASGVESGHGKTVDLGVVDELFADDDDRRDQALIPAMATKPFAQTLVCSTAGTDDSEPLNRLVARGRRSVEAGSTSGLAYFEWSAGLDEDPDDPATWWGCMPALGFTISEAVVRQAREDMTDGEFRRAFLNQPTRANDRVIPQSSWDQVCDLEASPGAGLVFGVDVNPERSAASIVAAAGGVVPVVELVEHRDGTGWLVERTAELVARWGDPFVFVDGSGPAASMIGELQAAGVHVRPLPPKELVAACGSFFDRVIEARIRIRRDTRLDAAAAGVVKRPVGDAWAWARKHSSVNVSPLIAATLAMWGATSGAPQSKPTFAH